MAELIDVWERDIVPALHTYIAIPNLSPSYDAAWAERGHMADAVALVKGWIESRPIDGMTVTVQDLPGRTPLIVCDIPAFGTGSGAGSDDLVVLYGHLDKQPEMTGWSEGLGPWTPVRRGDRLYGRGAADDGYAAFAALAAIEDVRARGGRHARCVVLIEASEESGSPDLPAHVEHLAPTLGSPSLIVCLDSGAASWDRLWVTTSLRGLVRVVVTASVLEQGVHSGAAGGVVPSSFRVLRELLDRIEDATTGEILLPELHTEPPADRVRELQETAAELGPDAAGRFPLVPGVTTMGEGDAPAQLLARCWKPSLAYVGVDGLPPVTAAGNVLRPATTLALSFRLPPTADPDAAAAAIERVLTENPPSGARVDAVADERAHGWNAPPFAPWLATAMDEASTAAWGQPARTIGEGGTIPFMAMLGQRFPDAQFLVTGVLGPETNAHGPDEFLDVAYAARLTAAIAHVLDAHARR